MLKDLIKCIKTEDIPTNYQNIVFYTIDFSYNDSTDDDNKTYTGQPLYDHVMSKSSEPPSIGVVTIETKINKEDIMVTDDIYDIYENIMDFYYNLSKKSNIIKDGLNDIDFDYTTMIGNRKLISRILNLSNYIAMEGRIGAANILIVPNENIKQLLIKAGFVSNMKIILNPTNKYDDKIFLIYVSQDQSKPGLMLIHDDSLKSKRYYKVLKLLGREISINYVIKEIGQNCHKFIQVINL